MKDLSFLPVSLYGLAWDLSSQTIPLMLEIVKMAAKFFYQDNTLVNVIASERASRYVRTKEVILSDRSGDVFPASLLACELGGTVGGAVSQHRLSEFRYAPYGLRSETLSEVTQLGFNGEYCLPGVALYLLGNGYRAYNPGTMRFVSPDSISPFHVLNAYSYCRNDPINNADPSGHRPETRAARLRAASQFLDGKSGIIASWAATVRMLGKQTLLEDARDTKRRALEGMQLAYAESGDKIKWLSKKLRKRDYNDSVDMVREMLDKFVDGYEWHLKAVNREFNSKVKLWAENEANINDIVQQARLTRSNLNLDQEANGSNGSNGSNKKTNWLRRLTNRIRR